MKAKIVFIYLAFMISGCSFLVEPTKFEYDNSKVLSETYNLITNNYPYLKFKEINIDSIYSYYSARLADYQGDRVFNLLNDVLCNLKDGHVWFYTPGGFVIQPYTPPRSIKDKYAYDPNVIRNYFSKPLNLAGENQLEYGILDNNIGYIYISSMKAGDGKWINDILGILASFKDTKGLILDVRNNGGGSEDITRYILRNFLTEPMLSPIWVDSHGNEDQRFLIYPLNTYTYQKNVALLQNGKCFSAAEGFINTMRELPNVTTIGDTTAGGSGWPEDFNISYNLTIHLSTKSQLTYDGKYIEQNGLEPDILIPQNIPELKSGRDIQLEAAISFLSKEIK